MTIALRAMQAEVGDALRPISATTLFCSPVPHGGLEIRVEVLRRGNLATQLRATLSSTELPGPGLEVSATFSRVREGLDVAPVAMPADLRSVDDSPDFLAERRASAPPFFHNFDNRIALGHRWWEEGWEPGPPRFARWHRYRVPARLEDGRLDPLALPPIADTVPPSLLMALGPGHRFEAPSLDLTIHFLDDTRCEWLCTHTTCRRARMGYATADVEVWDRDGRLVAFGTQMMMLRRRRGP